MGEVFRAVACGAGGFEKQVVVKRILPAHAGRPDIEALFVREAKLMSGLTHPNIVQVIDFGRGDDGAYFLVLELVGGIDLGRFRDMFAARGERLPAPIALFIAAQALRGLGYAHTVGAGDGAGLVHRDVSPSNVLLSAVGEVKVADFGVALVTDPRSATGDDGALVGKPSYMAPEQLAQSPLDPRADLFAMGVVLFQILTDALPFKGAVTPERMLAAQELGIPSVSALRPDLPAGIDALLERALALRREDRFPDARAMAQAIEALRAEGATIATADDLADAVTWAMREAPAEVVPVVALLGVDPARSEPTTELERAAGAGDIGAFTLKITATAGQDPGRRADLAANMRLDSTVKLDGGPKANPDRGAPLPVAAMDTPRPVAATKRGRVGWIVGLAAATALCAAAAAGLSLRGRGPATEPTRASEATSAKVLAGPATPPAEEPVAASSGAPAPTTSAPLRVMTTRSPAAPAQPADRGGPLPDVGAGPVVSAPPAAPAAACRGWVLLSAAHAWDVSGGPTPTQAPGKYEWPCGTYRLTATSRMADRTVRTGTVAVSPLAQGRLDLR
jgi:hypothetical protein